MFATRTASKVSKTLIPTELKGSMKEAGNTKNAVNLVIFSDDARAVRAANTNWDGGSKNYYYIWHFGRNEMMEAIFREGDEITLGAGWALVVLSHFCGSECTPAVYVRNTDLAAFFGVAVPETMPAEVAADWIDEKAETAPKREAKKLREVAAKLRKLTGLVSA